MSTMTPDSKRYQDTVAQLREWHSEEAAQLWIAYQAARLEAARLKLEYDLIIQASNKLHRAGTHPRKTRSA